MVSLSIEVCDFLAFILIGRPAVYHDFSADLFSVRFPFRIIRVYYACAVVLGCIGVTVIGGFFHCGLPCGGSPPREGIQFYCIDLFIVEAYNRSYIMRIIVLFLP